MTIDELVTRYTNSERPVGNVIDILTVEAQAIAAVSFYAGYAALNMNAALLPTDPVPVIDVTSDISVSEWAIIRPLFMLYVERENALHLEASRGMGIDVFGRTTSEISSDIQMLEDKIPLLAFSQPVVSV